ncbi:MAG: hypothetical protein K0V04_36835, partial [Deltaproteobacteria bacterium]|nr:hypothetical protein [Deltaproteobacteria bacterium]
MFDSSPPCRWLVGWMLAVGVGCNQVEPIGDGGNEASTGQMGSSSAGSGADGTASGSTSTGGSSTSETGSVTGDTSGEPPLSCAHPEGLQVCSLLGPGSCPAGFHCVPELIDGVFDRAVAHCFPVADSPVPIGDDCSFDPDSCNDDCERFAFCSAPVGADQGQVCVSVCTAGEEQLPTIDGGCASEASCVPSDGEPSLCWPKCNPLDVQCPTGASACVQVGHHRAVCQPNGYGTAGLGEVCSGVASCEQGSVCQPQADLGARCQGQQCCTQWCDLSVADAGCSAPEHECIPYHLP